MAGSQSNSGVVPFDKTTVEVLELFCNTPEQSYEQFLSTFTHLTPDSVMGGPLNVFRGHNSTSLGEKDRRNRGVETVDERISFPGGQRNLKALSTDLEELELDGSVPAGRLSTGATFPSDPHGKITDNSRDDMEDEEEPLHNAEDVCVLPGEAEEDLPVYTPSVCHYTLLDLSSVGSDHRTHTSQTECQSETDEVVPFCLDDAFDYDNVELHHKHPIQCCTSRSS